MTGKRFSIEQTTINECIVDKSTGEQLDTVDYTERLCEVLNELHEENERLKKERNHFERKKTEYLTEWNTCRIQNTELKNIIQEAYTNERTAIGRNVLKQLINNIEEEQ